MSVPGFEGLPGRTLASGTFTISAQDNRRVIEVVEGNARDDDVAHPVWAYVATQRGIGISVADLCALANFDVNDGPMLGSVDISYTEPLRVGVQYTVDGEILDIERKDGRSGTFDLLTFRERLRDAEGSEVAASTNVFILPRGTA